MKENNIKMIASQLPEARRIHDEKVYLVEDRSDKPKEIFKQIRTIIQDWRENQMSDTPVDLLDIGSATGDFLSYVAREFHGWRLTGLDVSEKMLDVSRIRLPEVDFVQGSILDEQALAGNKYDVITCMGVLSIFDSLEVPVKNLVDALKPNGLLIIFGMMNEYAMDVLVRCRNSNYADEPWQIGYNAFSREYYERVLNSLDRSLHFSWTKFRLPFEIAKTDDLLRNWTVVLDDEKYQQIRGTSQLSTQYILTIKG